MQTTINWGILAPGRIAHKFAHDLKLVAGAHLLAVDEDRVLRREQRDEAAGDRRAYLAAWRSQT